MKYSFVIQLLASIMLFSCRPQSSDHIITKPLVPTRARGLVRFKNFNDEKTKVDFLNLKNYQEVNEGLTFRKLYEKDYKVVHEIFDEITEVELNSGYFLEHPPEISFIKTEHDTSLSLTFEVFNLKWDIDQTSACDEDYYFVFRGAKLISVFLGKSECSDEGYVEELTLQRNTEGVFYLEKSWFVSFRSDLPPKIEYQEFMVDNNGVTLL